MARRWGRLEAPADWAREVPYDIRERSFQFAVEVIRAVRRLPSDPATRVVAHQLVKAATSVGANVEEADGAESRRDFIHKLSIARKEARETRYWLRLVRVSVPHDEWASLQGESEKITRIISAIIRSRQRHAQ
ncbi:MAG: four helix bundle protein [Chloroflexota bacterium]